MKLDIFQSITKSCFYYDVKVLLDRGIFKKKLRIFVSKICLKYTYIHLPLHSELFCLFLFGNWKFENLPISIPLSFILLFRPYIFIIQSKKSYRLCRTLKKIILKSGKIAFLLLFPMFSLVGQVTNLIKSHTFAIYCRKFLFYLSSIRLGEILSKNGIPPTSPT